MSMMIRTTTLVLQNPDKITVHLCEGDILGELQQVCEVSEGEGVKEMSDPVVGQVFLGRGDKEVRVEKLHEILEVDKSQLTNVELAQLQQVIEDYEDIFAMN